MHRIRIVVPFVAGLLVLSACQAAQKVSSITIDAGDVPRRNAPVTARLAKLPVQQAAHWQLVPTGGPSRRPIAAQVERTEDGAIVRWIEPDLQAGQTRTYDLIGSTETSRDSLRFASGDAYRDLRFGDRGIYRHMTHYDPADHAGTFKTFHHVFSMHGQGFITNGPGSEEWGASGQGIRFPHHRGLFFAYSKTPYGDFWHGKGGVSQRHQRYLTDREFTGPIVAREVSVNHWTTADDKPVIRDTRELTAWRVRDEHVVLDFNVTLETLTGETVPLGGDVQHAGFHFRAANEVGQEPATQPTATTRRTATTGGSAVYTRPASAVAKGNDIWADCPWVHAAFSVKGHPYGVSEMNAPTNPQPTVFSTRPYGRFGAFADDQAVAPGKPLKLSFRFIVRSTENAPNLAQLDAEYHDWINPVKVTVAE